MNASSAPACTIASFVDSTRAMRCTQFGHQVPRRNSAIKNPRRKIPKGKNAVAVRRFQRKFWRSRSDPQSFRVVEHQ